MIAESSKVLDFRSGFAFLLLQHELEQVALVGTGGYPLDALHVGLVDRHLPVVPVAVPLQAVVVQAEFAWDLN